MTRALRVALFAVVAAGCGGDTPFFEHGLSAREETEVLEEVVRHAIRSTVPPCRNYGSKEAYCLSVGAGMDPSSPLLAALADIRPPVRPLSACIRDGLVERVRFGIDPRIEVEWLRALADGSMQARVTAFCYASEPIIRKAPSWTARGGWIGSCGIPTDCDREFPLPERSAP